MRMVRDAAHEGNEEARKYLKRISLNDRQIITIDDDSSDQISDDLNTPDLIGGMRSAEHNKGLIAFLRRKFNV